MHIGLIGTFDVDNFGDCMFPELYEKLLKDNLPDVKVSLFSPSKRPAAILSYSSILALPEALCGTPYMSCDALVLVGGETLGFGHSSGTYNYSRSKLSVYLRLWAAPLYVAISSNRSVAFIAHCVGARKMKPEVNREIAVALTGAAHATFRDDFSRAWIRDGDLSYSRATDPMFLLDHLQLAEEWRQRAIYQLKGKAPLGKYLVAQVSKGYGGNNLDAWVKEIAKIAKVQGLMVVLLPICHFLDDEYYLHIAEEKLRKLGVKTFLVKGRINVKDTAAVLSQSAGYVGSSLHGAVAAVAFGLPLAVLGHSPDGKHEGTLNSVGIFGCTAVLPQGLSECFLKSLELNREQIRERAQYQARKDFCAVISALKTVPTSSDLAKNAIERLVDWERSGTYQTEKASEAKRFILRMIGRNRTLHSAYHRLRLRLRITRSKSAE